MTIYWNEITVLRHWQVLMGGSPGSDKKCNLKGSVTPMHQSLPAPLIQHTVTPYSNDSQQASPTPRSTNIHASRPIPKHGVKKPLLIRGVNQSAHHLNINHDYAVPVGSDSEARPINILLQIPVRINFPLASVSSWSYPASPQA